MRQIHLSLLISMGLCVATHAGEGAGGAQSTARDVAPFVSNETSIVAHVDFAAFDVRAYFKWIAQAVRATGSEQADLADRALDEEGRQWAQWITGLRNAGGSRAAAVLDYPTSQSYLYVVPLEPGADVRKVTETILSKYMRGAGVAQPATKVIRGSLVLTRDADLLDQVANQQPANRADIAEALAAVDGFSITVVVLLTPKLRSFLDEQVQQLPAGFGGGSVAQIVKASNWIALGANLPPNGNIRLVIQASDAASAKTLTESYAKFATSAKAIPFLGEALSALQPKTERDRLVAELDAKQLDALGKTVIAPALLRMRSIGMRNLCMNNARELTIACLMYGDAHKLNWPDSLDQLVKPYTKSDAVLQNPRQPGRDKGYVYIKPPGRMNQTPRNTVVLHEWYEKWPADGLCVGFADGSVQWVADETEFKRMLRKPEPQPPAER